MNSKTNIPALLEEFIETTKALSKLLKDDLSCFSTHNIEGLEKNNTQKQNIQIRMNALLEALQTSPELSTTHGSLYQNLKQYGLSLPPPNQAKLEHQLVKMQDIFSEYKHSMLLNHQVVCANLSYLRDLMITIIHGKNKEKAQSVTYDSRGELG